MIDLDKIDRKILVFLQEEGRLSNADLAERVNLSPSACLRRVKRLEDDGVIDGYAMLINQAAIGKPSNVFVEIALTSQSEESISAFETAVRRYPEIMECYLMSGEFDYLLRVVISDAQDYERIHKTCLSCLPGVARIRSNFALRTVCKSNVYQLGEI